jgi:protein TonB
MRRGFRVLLIGLFLSSVPLTAQDAPEVFNAGGGVSAPVLVREVKPQYTPEAKAAGIEGEVQMSAVVLSDGTVGEVAITRSLDAKFGLDEEAVKAATQWQFEPGKKDGKPVPVRVTIEMAFTLKK